VVVGVRPDGSAARVRAVLDEVDPDRSLVRSFGVRAASLDDVFLALTGHPAKPAAADADGSDDEQEATAHV
jgi:ABC-2 type transport system ATP-binding protein